MYISDFYTKINAIFFSSANIKMTKHCVLNIVRQQCTIKFLVACDIERLISVCHFINGRAVFQWIIIRMPVLCSKTERARETEIEKMPPIAVNLVALTQLIWKNVLFMGQQRCWPFHTSTVHNYTPNAICVYIDIQLQHTHAH